MKIRPEDRYNRNTNTITCKEQDKLSESCVAVVGLGGLGGGVTELLARTGVGTLILIDGDRFDATNLNRQLLSRENLIGVPKAEAAADRVFAINSSVRVTPIKAFLTDENAADLVRGANIVVDCLDTIDARFILQDAARTLAIPLVSGAIAGVSGQVTVMFPDDPGFELIYGARQKGGTTGAEPARGIETRTGNISYCAALIASFQASETVKVLLNRGDILRNRLLIADLWSNTVETMTLL